MTPPLCLGINGGLSSNDVNISLPSSSVCGPHGLNFLPPHHVWPRRYLRKREILKTDEKMTADVLIHYSSTDRDPFHRKGGKTWRLPLPSSILTLQGSFLYPLDLMWPNMDNNLWSLSQQHAKDEMSKWDKRKSSAEIPYIRRRYLMVILKWLSDKTWIMGIWS